MTSKPYRIMMLGGTGTIGRALLPVLVDRGHRVIAFVRSGPPPPHLAGVEFRFGDLTKADSIKAEGFRGEKFDILISCLASRTGDAVDAWLIDYQAHRDALTAAQDAGVKHMILLSAICVQKPQLAFQHAKLAFEKELIESGTTYSIVRPTAFFKSLSGQVKSVKEGKPFLLFGDGTLTSCKPISNRDLAQYLANCIGDQSMHNRILPIGGPGDAITPLRQGELLFELMGQNPRFRHVPTGLLDIIIRVLNVIGRLIPAAAKKAEFAKIGRYYATESMLVLDRQTGRYDASATPSTGNDSLQEYYRRLVNGETTIERGDHSVF